MQIDVDNLMYGTPTIEQAHLLNKDSYLDSLFADLTHVTYPKNSSEETKKELNELVTLVDELKSDERAQKRFFMYDSMYHKFVIHDLVKKGGNEEEIKNLVLSVKADIDPLLMKLKYFFQRPRPNQLAAVFKLKLFPYGSVSADSPSYPSGHAFQAKVLTEVIGNTYPKTYQYLNKILNDVLVSRMYMGLHYQSDIDGGIVAAERVLNNKEFKLKYRL